MSLLVEEMGLIFQRLLITRVSGHEKIKLAYVTTNIFDIA